MDQLKDETKLSVRCQTCGNELSGCTCAKQPIQTNLCAETQNDAEEVLQTANRVIEESQNADDRLIGKIVGGKFQIISRLGAGGMSVVYRAKHLLLQRDVVVKLVSQEKVTDQKAVLRFAQEAKAAALLSHPNIVNTREFGIAEDGYPYIVMDFVEGKSLAELIAQEGRLSPEKAVSLVLQVCEGLAHAHEKGVIHRDVKPGNIMCASDSEGRLTAKIADFGIAKITDDSSGQDLTATGDVIGSPLYMSPEQCRGKKLDARSDIYSLGCVLFEAVTGEPPFKGSSSLDTLMLHVAPDPPEFKQPVPAGLEQLIFHALEKDPGKRFQSMSEMAKALDVVDLGSGKAANRRRRKRRSPFTPQTIVIAFSVAVLFLVIADTLMVLNSDTSWKDHLRLGQELALQRNSSAAEKQFELAEKLAQKADAGPALMEIYGARGDMYWKEWSEMRSKEGWDKSWNNYYVCKQHAAFGTPTQKAHALEMLAQMQYENSKFASAEEFLDEALKYRKAEPGELNEALALTQLQAGKNYIGEKKYKQADLILNEALSTFTKINTDRDKGNAMLALRFLGISAKAQNKNRSATIYFNRAIELQSSRPFKSQSTIEELQELRDGATGSKG